MADRIDLDELERLERLERQATPAPWAVEEFGNVSRVGARWYAPITLAGFSVASGYTPKSDPCYADRDLLTALRNAAPALLAELRRLRKIEAAAVNLKRVRETASDLTQDGYRAIDEALRALDGAVEEKANG